MTPSLSHVRFAPRKQTLLSVIATNGLMHRSQTIPVPSVQSELGDVLWIGPEFTSLDALDDVGQHRVGFASQTNLLALSHDQPIEKFDFRSPALLHILSHRRPLFGGGALALPEALLIAGAHRRFITFSRARNHLGG